jgi:hypothetical protein
MGFLQQDTNNIILDAVLTNEGRRRLAANDGSFRVVAFSLGDDEVDYGIIQKFGRNVGREKIEKNTPIFEALTNATLESRSRLITIADSSKVSLATYTLTNTPLTFNNVTATPSTQPAVSATLQAPNSADIPSEIQDSVIVVSADRRFVQVAGATPFQTVNNVDYYNIVATSRDATNSIFGITFSPKTLIDQDFTIYGNSTNKTQISTFATIQGRQSGLSKTFAITLNKTT